MNHTAAATAASRSGLDRAVRKGESPLLERIGPATSSLYAGVVVPKPTFPPAAKRATSNQLPLLRNTIAKSAEAASAV